MKLIYDIAVMAQLVAACQSANTEIVKAEQLVQQVRSHSDWTCKEKSVIDELMQECKSLVQRMREDQSSFLRVLKDVEGELNDTENSVSNLFSGVESILGKVLGIPVAIAHVAGGGLLGAASAIANSSLGSAVTQAWNQWTEGIDIQNQMMDQFNPDHIGVGLADDFIEKMKEIGEDIMDTDVIWHGPGTIGGGVTRIMEDILSQETPIPWSTSGLTDDFVKIMNSKIEIHGMMQEAQEHISDILNGGVGATINPNAIPINGVIDTIGSNIGNVTEVIGNGIGNVVDSIGDGIGNIASSISSGIGSGISGVANGLGFGDVAENVICGNGISDFAEQMKESVLQGRTEYGPWSQNFNGVQDALEQIQDVGSAIGNAVTNAIPVNVVPGSNLTGMLVNNVAEGWEYIQHSPIGDAVGDALRNITESIAICEMSNLQL